MASIFELPIEELPILHDHGSGYWLAIEAWCRQRGLMPLTVYLDSKDPGGWWPKGVFCIAAGKSPRGDFDHAVVWQCGRHSNNGKMVHDPHPDGIGLRDAPTDLTFFVRTFGEEGPREMAL